MKPFRINIDDLSKNYASKLREPQNFREAEIRFSCEITAIEIAKQLSEYLKEIFPEIQMKDDIEKEVERLR